MGLNEHEWHDTGSNGQARAVWARRYYDKEARCDVMPMRVLVTLWRDDERVIDEEPFSSLDLAKAFSDAWLRGRL